MSTSNEIPSVLVLGPITPSPESVRAKQLEYPKLEPAVEKHAPYEYARMDEFWNADDSSLDEEDAARELAKQYMLMGSVALNRTTNPELWSKRYTQATGELYGLPDQSTAQQLWHEQQDGKAEHTISFEAAAKHFCEYLDERFSAVYDALDIKDNNGRFDASVVADKFEAALAVLARDYDVAWDEWKIVRDSEKDSLRIVPEDKEIIIGLRRANVGATQLKALFTHEILNHVQRGVNGNKLSEKLGTGLPGYLDAEEGLGVFYEYAVGGNVPEKNIDRYVDIAYALGQIDGAEHTREELLAHAMQRAMKRNETTDDKKSQEDIEKEVYAHVNRIYRGSLGNEHIGIFTKDISYHKGFIEMGQYVQSQLDSGKTVEEVFNFLSSGKFDPTNQKHLEYMQNILDANDPESN